MKRTLFSVVPAAILAMGILISPLVAAGDGWVTDFEAAKKAAAKDKKDLLIDFTGSDWCVWCKKLDKEVFAEAAFKTAAPKDFVLVTLDYPQQKQLPDAEKKQNDELMKEFEVQGFPTIILADATGRPYAQTGYQPGGADSYLKHLAGLRKARETRDTEFAAAAKAQGIEKAKHLKAGLAALDSALASKHYAKTYEEIISLDKDDTLGLKKERELKEATGGLEKEVQELAQAHKSDDLIKKVDEFLADRKLTGAAKQEVLFFKINAYPPPDGIDGADKLMDDIIAVDGKTEVADRARQIKSQITKMRAASSKAPSDQPDDKKAPDKDKPTDKSKDKTKEKPKGQ